MIFCTKMRSKKFAAMDRKIIKTGVIGYPAKHSLSPLIHTHWIKEYGFPAVYEAIETPPDHFSDTVRRLAEEGFIGFNVTIPYKQSVMDLCDTRAETARRIGAVNTVLVREDGRLHGMNTDSFGFVENVLAAEGVPDLSGGAALVLGAGGAARAVVHGLMALGVRDVRIANRTRDRAEEVGTVFPVRVIDWAERGAAAEGVRILVNATAMGMTGMDPLDFNLAHLPKDAAVCDIVYRPLETELLRAARMRGNPVITGIGMLLHQARPAFQAWFGVMPDVTGMLLDKVKEATQ